MFLKRERPETDDFAIFGCEGNSNITRNSDKCEKTPLHTKLKMSLHILAFQKIPSVVFFFFPNQKIYFVSGQGFCPSPLADMKNEKLQFLVKESHKKIFS